MKHLWRAHLRPNAPESCLTTPKIVHLEKESLREVLLRQILACERPSELHIQPPVSPFIIRGRNWPVSVSPDDAHDDDILGTRYNFVETEDIDWGTVFGEDEGGGGAFDAHLEWVKGVFVKAGTGWVLAWCGSVGVRNSMADLPGISTREVEAGWKLQSGRGVDFEHVSAW